MSSTDAQQEIVYPLRSLYLILGESKIQELSQHFYDAVYEDDKHPEFRDMFRKAAPKDLAVYSQVSFLVQKFGGPEMWGGMKKDSKFIIDIHKNFMIHPEHVQYWTEHMANALDKLSVSDPKIKAAVKLTVLKWVNQFMKAIPIRKQHTEEINNYEKNEDYDETLVK